MKRRLQPVVAALIASLLTLSPNAMAASAGKPSMPDQSVVVKQVWDGDTLRTTDNVKVRLLGIDTPELGDAKRGEAAEPFGERARERAKELVEGQAVTLHHGVRKTDDYKRRLAHVILSDGRSLGEILVAEGLALTYVRWPDIAHVKRFMKAEKRARKKRLGAWKRAHWLIDHLQARKQIGAFRIVTGRILSANRVNDRIYLNFGEDYRKDFTILIRKRDWKAHFKPAGWSLKKLEGKMVEARGRLLKKGGPALWASHPLQLTFIEK
ncbi:thermonuclease family protein [Magnetofaba australis]|uniref:Putative nuclease n=1 Tax=Magnetofaba australis IT-1 TaxID=1434232 RepID=A0A1Y2K7Z6_9PROT|nr:thermonuclease family protein [Magnetofaba australis]OSM06802.1 putative nuclease [Magnetofaba australis IT-1]